MVSSTIKAVIITTGITVMALFLYLPIALDLSLYQSPILWSSFLSWLKPPYLFVVINFIIILIVTSSSYHDGEEEEEEEVILHGDDYKIIQTEQIEVKEVDLDPDCDFSDPDLDFPGTFPPPIVVAVVERSEVVYAETEEEILGVINGGDEISKSLNQDPSPMIEESENLDPAEKPLATASSGHRKPVKASLKGGKSKRKVLKVTKPKRREVTTMENTWKMVTEEGKSTSLTCHHRRSDTVGVDGGEVQVKERALRKSVTFKDMTNYQKSPSTVTSSPVKMKKEMSPSREELNRRVEEFIKKCKEERLLESMRLDKVVVA
ncbi:hypothetical protein AALP_AA1G123100 [Arabis alpina]|uniref:DUF4408 domain-containing protein n=1 Tax=Arabis alpina TaxID=50452 RepID=A0A087HMR5_ARAAL|nr:hypothetical protein AALP_AA1G123100 [Arabis alpina]